jgi:hypothetical protein
MRIIKLLSSCRYKFDNQYQVLAIVGDNSEEFDDNNNPVLNPANITRGANHLAEGNTIESKFDYQQKSGTQSKKPSTTSQLYRQMQAKMYY